MAKTNYTKVEEALTDGLRKIEVERLLDAADEAGTNKQGAEKNPVKLSAERKQLLAFLKHAFKYLKSIGHDAYKKLEVDKKEIQKLLLDPINLSPADWEKLKVIGQRLVAFKEELEQANKLASDSDVIERQRQKQTTKRFNVNDKWLPLK